MTSKNRTSARGILPVAAILLGFAAACAPSGGGYAPTPVVIYNSNPSPLPGNVVSQGFQCCEVDEVGDQIAFAPGTPRNLQSATVTMSDWAIRSDYPGVGDATGWDHPLTLSVYAVGPNDLAGNPTKGSTLATTTQVVHIPWRPEADPINCPINPTKFQSTPGAPDTNCFNGLAFQVTFDLSVFNLTAPSQVVWGLAHNTQTRGYNPIGTPGPYNSLNVGVDGTASVGTQVNPAAAWISGGTYPYCDASLGTGVLRPDVNCGANNWAGYAPQIRFTAL